MLRAFAAPRVISTEFFAERISQATDIVARACGLEAVLPISRGPIILAARAMSDARLSVEFHKLAQTQMDDFNNAVGAFKQNGSLSHECCSTELSPKVTMIRNVN